MTLTSKFSSAISESSKRGFSTSCSLEPDVEFGITILFIRIAGAGAPSCCSVKLLKIRIFIVIVISICM